MKNPLLILVDYDPDPNVTLPWQVQSFREGSTDPTYGENVDEILGRIGEFLKALIITSRPATTILKSKKEIQKEAERYWKIYNNENFTKKKREQAYKINRALLWTIQEAKIPQVT